MLAEITVAQVSVGVDLEDDEISVTAGEGAHGAGRQGVLTAEGEGEAATRHYRLDDRLELVEGGTDAGCNLGLDQGRNTEVAIWLAPQFLIEQFELAARGEDRGRPGRRAGAVTDRRLEAERYDDRARRLRTSRTVAIGILETIRWSGKGEFGSAHAALPAQA